MAGKVRLDENQRHILIRWSRSCYKADKQTIDGDELQLQTTDHKPLYYCTKQRFITTDLARVDFESEPAVVNEDEKLSSIHLQRHVPAAEQCQSEERNHSAVADVDLTRSNFLQVDLTD